MAGTRRVTLREASEELGVSLEAVRKREKRDSLRSDKDPDGRVYVYMEEGEDASSPGPDTEASERSELVEALRDEISHLRRESERKDTIILSLSQANAEQARTLRALEAPPDERESPETVEEEPEEGHATAPVEAWEELGAERARREMAESTLHEGMAEERRRRENAERERDDLRQRLYALRRPPEAPETVEGAPEIPEPRSAAGGAQEGAQRRPWWRRMFGG
jgi:hypothetical protein